MNSKYYINHWVLTLVTGPLLLSIPNFRSESIQGLAIRLLDMYDLMLVFSALFSIPTLATYYIIFKVLERKKIRPVLFKLILIFWTIAGITTTMSLIGGSATKEIIVAYSASAVISGVLLPIGAGQNKILMH